MRSVTVTSVTHDSVELTWREPKSDGGAPILSYSLQRQRDTEPDFTHVRDVNATDMKCVLGSLDEVTSYTFGVLARNEAGLSKKCAVSDAIKTSAKLS